MKKVSIIITITFILFVVSVSAQGKFFTKDGEIDLNAPALMENIEAKNKNVLALLDTKTGEIHFVVLMKGFEFKKALMQEHFNNDYVESDKFPKAEFKGQIDNNNEIDYTKNGSFVVSVTGKLTIHGETNVIKVIGRIIIKEGKILANSVFKILLADYKITIPWMERNSIPKSIGVTVDSDLEQLKN